VASRKILSNSYKSVNASTGVEQRWVESPFWLRRKRVRGTFGRCLERGAALSGSRIRKTWLLKANRACYPQRMNPSLKSLQEAVGIRRQIDVLERRLASLFRSLPSVSTSAGGKRRMSAATRAKLSAAAKARWAQKRSGKKTTAKATKRKRGEITAAGRKRLSQLMKARWAARKRARS
jgi:hypothetical protein